MEHFTFDRFSEAALRQAATAAKLVVIKHNAFLDLVAELGGPEAVVTLLSEVATENDKPIAVNLETEAGSRTSFIGPASWDQGRLEGWVAGHADELAEAFGDVSDIIRPSDDR